ncbi:MAG TPA: hypothetical protein VK627_08450 [Edaphobacter sp.]|nr:hypothetical protein [Edaphobacter sp.]
MTHSIHRLWPKTRILHVVSDIAQERFYDGIELDATSSAEPKHLVRRTTELLESLPNHRIAETAGGVRRQEAL